MSPEQQRIIALSEAVGLALGALKVIQVCGDGINKKGLDSLIRRVEGIVCPPPVYIQDVSHMLSDIANGRK